MRVPIVRIVKALACLSIFWCALSLWYAASNRHRRPSDMADAEAEAKLLGGLWRHHQTSERNATSSSRSFGDPVETEPVLKEWRMHERHFCSHNLLAVSHGFARLRHVVVDPSKGRGRPGGEEIDKVLNQAEQQEYWRLMPGAFRVLCPEKPNGTPLSSFVSPFRNPKSHVGNQYLAGTTTASEAEMANLAAGAKHLPGTVLAVTRYEYANLYHTMTDFFSAFVNSRYFGVNEANVTILFIDGHPKGSLDSIWATLFNGGIIRFGQLKGPLLIDDLVWVLMGYDSPLHQHHQSSLPLHRQFREFFLRRHRLLEAGERRLNCSSVRVSFVWRRDYVAHPRNPAGKVVRKVANEEEILAEISREFPNVVAVGRPLERVAFAEQLRLATDTDVLAGMHGAALSHTMFLPQHAGLLELYPTYWSPGNTHFSSMARWRGLPYERWVNSDRRNELANHRTRIPNGVVAGLLRKLLRRIGCH